MKSRDGFTLVEVLMVVMLIASLAALGVTASGNYATQTKNATTKGNLQILRNGIGAANAVAQLNCGTNGDTWPPVSSINLNDITQFEPPDSGAVCTVVQITSANSREVVGGNGIPVNPWGLGVIGPGNRVYDCTAAPASGVGASPGPATGACLPANHKNCGTGTAYSHSPNADDGWCYDPTAGRIWANSENNGGSIGPPSTFESAF